MPEPPYRISLSVAHPDPDLPPAQHLGTARYAGPVPPTTGTWLGVEWDDTARGKHSGEYAQTGVKYFECRIPGAGSFIRPTAKGLSLGRSFIAAIRDRYLDDGALPHPAETQPVAPVASSRSPHSPESTLYQTNFNREIEVPSLDKISALFRQLDRLTTAGLEYAEVASAGDGAELATLGAQMARLRSLNLSFSLLPSLDEVDKIAAALPKLDALQLNSNRFTPIAQPTTLAGFARLTSLSLNRTLVSWAEIGHVSSSLAQLRHLELGNNNLTALDPSVKADTNLTPLAQLEELNLEGNQLTDWSFLVDELSKLPALSRLIVSSNKIATLRPPNATARPSRLTHVRHLDLSNNLIRSWSEIEALNELPALESLNIAGNPFLGEEADERGGTNRLQLIGWIGRVTKLEGTPIRPIERDDAERFYLATIAKDATLQTDEQRAAAHPPYVELTKKHGAASAPDPKPTMRSRLINLRVELPPSLAFGDGVTPTVAVLPTLRTMLLRSHIAKLAGRPVPKTKYKLIALLTPTADDVQISGSVAPAPTGKALEVEIPPAEEGRELGYWGLGDGDGVKVVEV